MKALGMIEVYGYLAAVEALDSALKTANVSLVDTVCVKGGLVTVLVEGDVGAVKASMDASAAAAERVGRIVSVHVIPRPAAEVMEMVKSDRNHPSSPELPTSGPNTPNTDKVPEPDEAEPDETEPGETDNISDTEDKQQITDIPTRNQMELMTVESLRKLARQIPITNMTRQEIRFARKKELIHAILENIGQEI